MKHKTTEIQQGPPVVDRKALLNRIACGLSAHIIKMMKH